MVHPQEGAVNWQKLVAQILPLQAHGVEPNVKVKINLQPRK